MISLLKNINQGLVFLRFQDKGNKDKDMIQNFTLKFEAHYFVAQINFLALNQFLGLELNDLS